MTDQNRVAAFRLKLTPRQRELLQTHLWVNADNTYDDIEEHGDQAIDTSSGWWALLDRLPEQTWELPTWWRRQLARAFDDLALDLEAGRLPYPRCVAEEVALVLAASDAQAALMDGEYADDVAALPETPNDRDWESAVNALVGVGHIDWCLSPGDAPEWIAESPAAASWFELFEGAEPRAAGRGFRR
jgi:hypothetical protein